MEEAHVSLVEFLSEYWSLWELHCESRGENAQDLYEAIGGEPE